MKVNKDVPISISTTFCYDMDIMEQIKILHKIGYGYVSLGMNAEHSGILHRERLSNLKSKLNRYNMKVDTIHVSCLLVDDDWEEIMVKTMESAYCLGCTVLVQHCTEFDFPEDEFQIKYKIVKERAALLEKLCAKYKMQVALENVMPYHQTKIVEYILRDNPSDWIGFCYDSSHDQIDGPRDYQLLERWKHRLLTVHLSDRIKEFEDHVIPGEGFIDFSSILNIIDLKKVKFPLLFEVETAHSQIKDPYMLAKRVYEIGRKWLEHVN